MAVGRHFMLFFVSIAFIVLGVLGSLLGILITFLRHPLTALKKKNRESAPSILLDQSYGTHGYVRANGIRFHYVAAGDRSKPLMLFLHGFPEFWFSWRYQLKEFQKDYFAVAIDMRGYGDTDHPTDKDGYMIDNLVKDIVELIPALGYTKCVLVAHDWGGAVAWQVVHRHPNLVERFIPMNCPHPREFIVNTFQRMKRFSYMFFLKVPALPEFVMGLRDYRAIGSAFLGKGGLKNNRSDFGEEVIEAYKFMFSQPNGLTCPINYYRCMLSSAKSSTEASEREKMTVPTLLIWGNDDQFLSSDLADRDRYMPFCADVTVKRIANCSHWVQQDHPDTVNQFIREFVASK